MASETGTASAAGRGTTAACGFASSDIVCRAADKVNGQGWCTSEVAVDATRYSQGSQSVPSTLMHRSMNALMRWRTGGGNG
jgi:hypothetical protein